MGPGRPARQRWSASSTTNRRPDLGCGPSRASAHYEAWAWRAGRAPQSCHATAKLCRLADIKNSFQRSVQWSPAIHREQPVGRLRGGCARRACGVSCTLFVDGASWRAMGMASTRVMVPKDCNHSGRWRAAHLPAHQRGRWMDGALQVRGPLSRARAAPPALADANHLCSSMLAPDVQAAAAELVQPGTARGAPRSDDGK